MDKNKELDREILKFLAAGEEAFRCYLNLRSLCETLLPDGRGDSMLWVEKLQILPEGIEPGDS